MKKLTSDIIILRMCTKNHNHMMNGSWDTELQRYRQTELWSWKSKFWKKIKKIPGDITLILSYIHVYHKWKSYDTWFLKYKVPQTEIFIILGHFFFPFSPLTTWKIKILTLKNIPGDIIILHICTINDNHMMYGSWGMERTNRHNFLSFWTVFCPFTPLWTQKIKIFKNMEKTPGDIIILQT